MGKQPRVTKGNVSVAIRQPYEPVEPGAFFVLNVDFEDILRHFPK